jgi:hypothetical protein
MIYIFMFFLYILSGRITWTKQAEKVNIVPAKVIKVRGSLHSSLSFSFRTEYLSFEEILSTFLFCYQAAGSKSLFSRFIFLNIGIITLDYDFLLIFSVDLIRVCGQVQILNSHILFYSLTITFFRLIR